MSIYKFEVTLENGENYQLKRYTGRPLLIVNTATKCGLAPQFEKLEQLYQSYRDKGFVVLGFPSNQFHQEVKDSQEAATACRTTYGVTFPMHQISDVNGDKALPLFKYLTAQESGLVTKAIKWNFTKFLINQRGEVIKRFAPTTDPLKIKPAIEHLFD
ncbi:glutathione peroxidase [Liquorilactobacillus sucicola DSM 21376 = JCM 15457]|uniref:Glutathione peroxidase n=1 Tax=Liquorilactobacillus sucicola DSM 21376 = JCM 15457 TaxID=1423806 RepID=A0A023CUA0_9LACO|nr:glutathione peroxidase [Liquorilactobacillus sucicola]KRN05390.1 glutathione peroxidase [Liquorilactobacillus sucicola DSM 21376 = JCM 15457]GAJ25463.1 glutathione peroxidase [Liquorilactobacillus sucicola DSM 21376 = JCM 15457]